MHTIHTSGALFALKSQSTHTHTAKYVKACAMFSYMLCATHSLCNFKKKEVQWLVF